jgi:predicted phosphodiesterase
LRRKVTPRALALLALLILTGAQAQAATPWKFVVYGDTRTDDTAHRSVLNAIQANTPDYCFIISVGDVVEDGTQASQWNIWQQACNETLGGTGQSAVPPKYMSVPGNHDQVTVPAGLANWNTYLPGQNSQFGNNGTFFTFDYENARFIILNPYESLTGAQYTMLQQAIQNNPQDWLFAIWHPPIFDFGPKVYESTLHTTWGVPLYQGGCDVIFAGHAHYYVRTLKLDLNGDKNPPLDPLAGTAQIVTGNGGAPLYAVDENHDNNGYMVAYSFDEAQPAYYGYTEISVNGAQATLRHIRADGTVMDTVIYTANTKPYTPTPAVSSTPVTTVSSTPVTTVSSTPTPTVSSTPTPAVSSTPVTTVSSTPTPAVSSTPVTTVSPTPTPTVLGALSTRVILAYPNPAQNEVRFTWQTVGVTSIQIKVFNVLGEQVMEVKQDNPGQAVVWSLQGIAPGIYFCRMITTTSGAVTVHPMQKIAILK